MAGALRIKRGGTLTLQVQARDDAGAAYDLTGHTVTSQLRDAGDALVASLAISGGGSSGLVTLSAADTSAWPVGTLRGDIRIAFAGGAIVHSETFNVQVDMPVTRP